MTKKPYLDNYDYTKLLDDIKLISRSTKIIVQESNKKKREFAGLLTEDLITRLFRDVKEMHKEVKHNGRSYGGFLNEEDPLENKKNES